MKTSWSFGTKAGPTIEYDVLCPECRLPGPVYDGKVRGHGPGPKGEQTCPGSFQWPMERIGDRSRPATRYKWPAAEELITSYRAGVSLDEALKSVCYHMHAQRRDVPYGVATCGRDVSPRSAAKLTSKVSEVTCQACKRILGRRLAVMW